MFSNNPVSDLPNFEDQKRISPERAYIWARFVIAILLVMVVGGALLLQYCFSKEVLPYQGLVYIAAFFVGLALTPIIYLDGYRQGYSLRECDVTFYNNVYFREITLQPFTEILHVTRSIGPIEKWLHLSTLHVHNASGAHLVISGIEEKKAKDLKAYFILRKKELLGVRA